MSKRLLTMLASVAALAILVAGCGGGDEEEPLTKAEYAKQGTAICQETLDEMQLAFRDLEKKEKEGKSSGKSLGTEFVKETMLPAYEAQLEELRDLPPPAADEARLNAIYAEMEKGIARLRRNIDEFFQLATRPLLKGRNMAEKYGLKGCMAIL